MNSTVTPAARIVRHLPALGLVAVVLAALAGLAYAAPVVAGLAPALVVPTMVAGWLVGFGLAAFLPFGLVVAVARLVAR